MNNIKLTALCLQITILGYTNTDHRCFITQNLILLIFKFYEYKPRVSANLIFSASCHKLVKIKNLDKGTALTNQIKLVCVCIVYIYTYMYICKCIYICVCKYVCVQPQEIEENLMHTKKNHHLQKMLQSEEGCKSFKIKKSISIKLYLTTERGWVFYIYDFFQ